MIMKVNVGGDLPESLLPELRDILKGDDVILIEGDAAELEDDKQLLQFDLPNSIEFMFNLEMDMDGDLNVHLDLEDFCIDNGLTIKKLIPPFTSPGEDKSNEFITYWEPGMKRSVTIPTNGHGETAIRVDIVTTIFDILWNTHSTTAETDYPLLVNDSKPIRQRYAIARMAGKDFGQIFHEELGEVVVLPNPSCPPFTVIKGK
jgi:hypothetical protein